MGELKQEEQQLHYINTLLRDTGLENVKDLDSCIQDRALSLWGQFSSHRPLCFNQLQRTKVTT